MVKHAEEKERTPEITKGVPATETSKAQGVTLSPAIEKALTDPLKKEDKTPTQPSADTENKDTNTSTQQAAAQSRTPGHEKSSHKKEKKHGRHQDRYTTGEKIYDQVNFWIIKGLILAATAAIAYPLKFGSKTSPNALKKAGAWFIEKVAKPIASVGTKVEAKVGGEAGKKLGQMFIIMGYGLASSVFLWFGGTAIAPIVRSFENNRKELIEKWNKKWGKPGDVEIGNEKFEYLPKQTWGDILTGRMAAWATIFTSFIVAYPLFGMSKKAPNAFRLDYFEEWLGRMSAKGFGLRSFSKTAEVIKDIPMSTKQGGLNELQEVAHTMPELAKEKWGMIRYRLGKIIALDFYATSAAIIVWNFTSRLSAKAREHGDTFFGSVKKLLFHGKQTDSQDKEALTAQKKSPPVSTNAMVEQESEKDVAPQASPKLSQTLMPTIASYAEAVKVRKEMMGTEAAVAL